MEMINRYFDAFESKDLDTISDMLADDVVLKDWNIQKKGKNEVVDAYRMIFDGVEEIKVDVRDTLQNNKVYIVVFFLDLKVSKTNTLKLKVCDIITTDLEDKIISVDAYRQ